MTTSPSTMPSVLRARDVADLTVAAGYPSISLLMSTEPAPRMLLGDVERLHELVREAHRQLNEQAVIATSRLMTELERLADRAVHQPTHRGLAIYVNDEIGRVFQLPLKVAARVTVEQTFATRDLVRALHRNPPHLVLVVHAACSHLYLVSAGGMRLLAGTLPLVRSAGGTPPAGSSDQLEGYLEEVDRMLGSHRARHPGPLVLAGEPGVLAPFRARSTNLHRLAGVVPAGQDGPDAFATALSELLAEYLRSRRTDALATFAAALAERPQDVTTGADDAWEEVHRSEPEMLLVEEGFTHPGRPRSRSVPVHDLVDDLIELVILRGGHLALVEPGDLAGHGHVALVSRSSRSPGRGTRRR